MGHFPAPLASEEDQAVHPTQEREQREQEQHGCLAAPELREREERLLRHPLPPAGGRS